MYGFQKAAALLRLKQRSEVGMTVIISPKWMFVAILTQPYIHSSQNYPAFLDGFAFSGLVNIQTRDKLWPETAGLEETTPSVMSALNDSTYVATVIPKEETTEVVEENNVDRE